MKFITKHKLLILILLLAAFLRFYKLGSLPALNADEASIGYNAYSLIMTGKDEHGHAWPVHFQSFNDYKPGGFFYIVLPFVATLGLNVWGVRVPGALLGVLTVLVVYLLAKKIKDNEKFALFATLLLAISPWHIHFSRGGWEVNAATFFITLGVYLFLKAVDENKYFALSLISFAVSIYIYHAALVVAPLLGLSLILIYRKKLKTKENRKLFLGSVLLAALLLVPFAHDFLSGTGGERASGVSIFADSGYIDRINEKRGNYNNPGSLTAKIIYNKPKEVFLEFSNNYFEHFWGEYLFLSGDDIERNKVPEVGELYIFEAPLLLFAFLSISKKRKNWDIILAWLLIAPIPAALTFQSPHALRSQNMVIPLTILAAYGLFVLVEFASKKLKKIPLNTFYLLLAAAIVWSGARYVHQYYVHMAKTYPYSSQYGLPELAHYIKDNYNRYSKFIITTRYDQPYILLLFYSKYPPAQFQNSHKLTPRDEFGFSTVDKFDKFEFRAIDFEAEKLASPGAMIIGTDEEILDEANVVKNIYGTNGFLYFQAVAN